MKELRLSELALDDQQEWKSAGIELPRFDRRRMKAETMKSPRWIHFGSGNIFRSFIAPLQQKLLNDGETDTGIIAAEAFDCQIIEKVYKPFDNLSLVVLMDPDGSLKSSVNSAVADAVAVCGENNSEWTRLVKMAENSSLQMISFTITEKGYSLSNLTGEYLPQVKEDIEKGPARPKTMMAIVASLVYFRYCAGGAPISLVSMDNCSHNGEKLQQSVLEIASQWGKRRLVEKGFLDYLKDSSKVSFPWTMIDKITPRPSEEVAKKLSEIGFTDIEIMFTDKHTCIAPFVNAEIPQYLVVEDHFVNGRPPLEKAGVIFTNCETVNKAERMKVCTCLNPLHTALAVFGCLLGYQSIASEMKNMTLRRLVERIGRVEGMPAVENPGILDPNTFLDEVLENRLTNPYIPDTPQRIVCDTSAKMSIRFGNTIRVYYTRPDLSPSTLICIPLTIAGWCRYLMGIDDQGVTMELSADPVMDDLRKIVGTVIFGKPDTVEGHLTPLLQNQRIFGVDLYEVGLGKKIEDYFKELIAGPGAVKTTLEKYIGK